MILLMGIAGSGKGTQGMLLAENLGYKILSTGELLRTYGSEDQHARMRTGVLITDQEVTGLLNTALQGLDDQDKVILDGYPRSVEQIKWLLTDDKAERFTIKHVLHLVASKDAVKARMLDRARADDTDEAIEARFNEYEKTTKPILSYLAEAGIDVTNIDAERSIEDIQQDIITIITNQG